MCFLVSFLLFLFHPFTTDKLLTPTNLHIRYQCSTRYQVNIIITILGHHPRVSQTPCLLGLISKGRTNPIHPYWSVFLEGFWDFHPRTHCLIIYQRIMHVASHKHFPPINSLNIICDYSISFYQCNHTMNHFHNTKPKNRHTNMRSNLNVTFQHNKPKCNDTLKHFMKLQK